MNKAALLAICCTTVCFPIIVRSAEPTNPTTAAIFAGRNLTVNGLSTVVGAPVVVNGNVVHNGSVLEVLSMYAGGTFSSTPASFQKSHGDLLFGGDVTGMGGPGAVLDGNLFSGGNISFLSTSHTVTGNVTAVGGVSQPFSFSTINGNLTSGGNVNLQGAVLGNVTYGTALTQGTFSSIGGSIVHGGAVTIPAYVPLTLPAGRGLAAGGTNITLANSQNQIVTPGVYGNLNFATGNTVTLTAGQYVFANILSSFSLNKLAFDTSGGPINLYIAGSLDFNVIQVINGEPLFAGGHPNPADSEKIFIEVAGDYIGDSSIFGTIFAPNGDIVLSTFSNVTGHALAGRDVVLNVSTVAVVPEPGSLGVLGACGLVLLGRRRKRVGG